MNLGTTITNGFADQKNSHFGCNVTNGILARNVHAKWNSEDTIDSIQNITFEIKQGECYGICGSVGDGKVEH